MIIQSDPDLWDSFDMIIDNEVGIREKYRFTGQMGVQCPQYVQMQSLHTYVVACFLITPHLKIGAY